MPMRCCDCGGISACCSIAKQDKSRTHILGKHLALTQLDCLRLIACAACIRFHVRCMHTLTVAIQIPDGDVRAAVATCVSCAWIKGACSTQAVGCRNSINYHGKAHVYIAHVARAPCGTT